MISQEPTKDELKKLINDLIEGEEFTNQQLISVFNTIKLYKENHLIHHNFNNWCFKKKSKK